MLPLGTITGRDKRWAAQPAWEGRYDFAVVEPNWGGQEVTTTTVSYTLPPPGHAAGQLPVNEVPRLYFRRFFFHDELGAVQSITRGELVTLWTDSINVVLENYRLQEKLYNLLATSRDHLHSVAVRVLHQQGLEMDECFTSKWLPPRGTFIARFTFHINYLSDLELSCKTPPASWVRWPWLVTPLVLVRMKQQPDAFGNRTDASRAPMNSDFVFRAARVLLAEPDLRAIDPEYTKFKVQVCTFIDELRTAINVT